jgi:hypothetical protein
VVTGRMLKMFRRRPEAPPATAASNGSTHKGQSA